ncbi:glycosyltransferase family 4 protein [Sulfuriroseicoccus oceanibius]|uniref:Uncharacterized protein n=1 Tax=Sulfuriroseicoccus oceanibius TaxID=2707525 RepID=A0A6B3L778_9BACT|nr:glycosyltransferase family 4 protein [Sulfuriroseicoccus oceanibius]QQL45472.1 hypothetical protein G3M56_002445 [Sulfuriroseicoccus oceanibius]
MSSPLHILFTNNALMYPAGTEIAVREVGRNLIARGHRVTAYSPMVGSFADDLRALGVEVVSSLDAMTDRPDVIHGHHEWETSLAAMHWPDVPVVSFVRGARVWQEAPCFAPNVVRYAAVDQGCVQRALACGVEESKLQLVLNAVDMQRFATVRKPRRKPKRALIFSNYAQPGNYMDAVMEGCKKAGVKCDVIGNGMGNCRPDPEAFLPEYDLVFAKSKAVLEALACGCGVIVCCEPGLGPVVTRENFEALRRESFFYDCMSDEITPDAIAGRIREWDPAQAPELTAHVREVCSFDRHVAELEALYREAAATEITPDPVAIGRFAAALAEPKTTAFKAGRQMLEYLRDAENREVPQDAATAAKEHDSLLDRYRKGRKAVAELKKLKKQLGK